MSEVNRVPSAKHIIVMVLMIMVMNVHNPRLLSATTALRRRKGREKRSG